SLFLPLILTFLPVFLICREADLWQTEKRREASEAWHDVARRTAARWERASKLTFWAETAAARFRKRIEKRLPASTAIPVDQDLLASAASDALRRSLPRSFPEPSTWLFSLSAHPEETPKPCTGQGLQTRFNRLIGSILHEIDRRNRFEPGRPRPPAWKQSLDRLFGFGASPELFDDSSRGRAFSVIFQNDYRICVWDFIQFDGKDVAVFLMLLPSGMDDANTARRLCFANWRSIARNSRLEPVYIPFSVDPAEPKRIRVRPGSPLPHLPCLRSFILRKSSEIRLRQPGMPGHVSQEDISTWYQNREFYGMSGEIRLPDRELRHVFQAGDRHLACWSSLDVLSGGLGLLIGPAPNAVQRSHRHAGTVTIFVWAILWLLLLVRTGLSGVPPAFGIRSQLAFWFLCLASVPLIIALSETGKLLVDLRNILLREYDIELGQALQELENEDSILTRRFADICNRQTENASRTIVLRARQLAKQPVDDILNPLWKDLSGLGIPIRSLSLFGHGRFEWSRNDIAMSPELGVSLINFIKPISYRLLKTLSPDLEARVPAAKFTGPSTRLDMLVTANVHQLMQKSRQIAETMADNKRMLKFHQFLKIDGDTWFLLVLIWEQSEAYIRHIRTRISDISAKYRAELEITRQTASGNHSLVRSGKPLRTGETGTRSTDQDRIMSVRSSRLPGFLLTAARPLAPLRQRLFKESAQVIAGIFGNLLLLLLSGGLLAAWLTTPLRKMVTALREVAAGRLDRKLNLARADELGQAANTLDAMTEWLRERQAMSLFVAPQVMEAVADGSASAHVPRRRPIVALTSDIRNFTTISETHPPDEVFSALNRHFRAMTPAIKEQGGIIDRFIGDAIQAVFYDDPSTETPPAARRALSAARAMMRCHRALQQERAAAGLFTFEIGIGLASGEAVCGVLGAEGVRLDYSVVGEAVTSAGVLEAASKAGRASRIICDSSTVSAAGISDSVLAVSGHPEAFEVADGFSPNAFAIGHPGPGLSVPAHPIASQPPTSAGNQAPPVRETNTANYSICIALVFLVSILLFSFSTSLTSSFRERSSALEQATLQHDLRFAASTNIPALHIANHLRMILLEGARRERGHAAGSGDSVSQVQARLQKAKRIYPALSWSLLRHVPERDPDWNSISLSSTEVVETGGMPFSGKASESAALFSMLKVLLTNGGTSHAASPVVQDLTRACFPAIREQGHALAFESYGHFNECSLFGIHGVLMWLPLVPPGWWEQPRDLAASASSRRHPAGVWWQGMQGGILLFLPAESLDEPSGLLALTNTMLERGTRLIFLPRGGSPAGAIGSATFDIPLTGEHAVIDRKQTDMERFPEMIAARPLPPPPFWMTFLETFLKVLSGFMMLCVPCMCLVDLSSRVAAYLPRKMVPLLAGAFVLTLAPSLLSGWMAGERRTIERKARLFDEVSESLSSVLTSLDEGAAWYIGQNISVFRHLATSSSLRERLNKAEMAKETPEREKAIGELLDDFFLRSFRSGFAPGVMQFLGPRGISVIDAGKTSSLDSTIIRELYSNIHSQVMRKLSPRYYAADDPADENKRMLEDLKGEEVKYVLLSLLSCFDIAAMMSAPLQYQLLTWGLNSHESFRIHLSDPQGRPQYALQVHLADDMLLHQQLRNWCETQHRPGTTFISMARNNPRITMPFSSLTVRHSSEGNRFTADVNSYLSHPREATADLLAAASAMTVHTFLDRGDSTELLISRIGSRHREHVLKTWTPFSPLLDRIDRESATRRGFLSFILFLMIYMAFRTASRFLNPVQALIRALEGIMG
ncbi:adenylate/guanylate cyclase domain-containing protein, partial [Candidatus Ozemobacteraceae bacterium]|nr:adenylate/guanylate cyclase domain-containing protein [Candidatus Ozemobacteraceae bacterium]